ncbi:MAG TPA: Clp protease N-terminal domain-containing protein [Pirellulaceae bacterium]|nr:Clp protease N-terminal domain-containing protein [Pirellulaceae bacterium]
MRSWLLMPLASSTVSRRPVQFLIWHLFWFMTVTAVFLALRRLDVFWSGLIVAVGSELVVVVMGTAIVVSKGPPCWPSRIRRGMLSGAVIAGLCFGWYPILLAIGMYDLRPLLGFIAVIVAGGGLGLLIGLTDPLLRPFFVPNTPPQVNVRPMDRSLHRALQRATDRVMRVLATARHCAAAHRHQIVTPEHLLCAMGIVDSGVARLLLARMGVDLTDTTRLAAWLAAMPADGNGKSATFSPELQRVLDLAWAQAMTIADVYRRTSNIYLGTEHLVLGLLAYDDCMAARVLTRHDVTLEKFRTELLKLMGN